MFPNSNNISKEPLVDPSKAKKINYNSRKFKKGLEQIAREKRSLMELKIPDSSKMYLTFNPIHEINNNSRNKLGKIKNYFQNIYETIRNLYNKI